MTIQNSTAVDDDEQRPLLLHPPAHSASSQPRPTVLRRFHPFFLLLVLLALIHLVYPYLGPDMPSTPSTPGRLPALGFNSWNAFNCDIDETKFIVAAKQMVSLGLAEAGYQYVNIDDCWSLRERDPQTHEIVPDKMKFPEGIKGTADKVHNMGLKLGIYSDAGDNTCAGYPGSLGYEELDVRKWEEWGVDYLKYDNCNVPDEWEDQYTFRPEDWRGPDGPDLQARPAPKDYDWSKSNSTQRFVRMRDAIKKYTEREILYSLCSWGSAHVERWANGTGVSYRMWADINPNWDLHDGVTYGFMPIINHAVYLLHHSDFYTHADLDMLEIGNNPLLTEAESRTHFGLWAALKSPLLIGTNLATITANDLAILKNPHFLAFNQDTVFGRPALPFRWGINKDWEWNQTHPAEYYSGASQKGIHLFMLNTLNQKTKKAVKWEEIPGLKKDGQYEVMDMWTGSMLGVQKGGIELDVEAHDTVGLTLTEVGGHHPLNGKEWGWWFEKETDSGDTWGTRGGKVNLVPPVYASRGEL